MMNVYQIQLTDSDHDHINTYGWSNPTQKIKAHLDRHENVSIKNFEHYTHVAVVMTDDREEAFNLMNLWDDGDMSLIKLVDGPCASMSVGDIVQMENGDLYVCSSFGFQQLETQ